MVDRRRLIASAAVAPLALSRLASASDTVDFRPHVEQVPADELTPIDASGMETFYPNAADYLWEESSELYGQQFRLNCDWVDYYSSPNGRGYQIPISGHVYGALILAGLNGRNFFIALNENPRPYRHAQMIQVRGYYLGTLAYMSWYETSRDPLYDIVEVDTLPLVAAAEVTEL